MYGLFYFVDGSVIGESTSIIQDAYINAGVTVTCKEDIQSQEGWIEVILPAKRRQDPKPVAAKLLFMAENYKVVQKRVAFLKWGDIWSSSQSGQEKGVVKQGMTSGSQMAKIGEQLKRDLKQQATRQLHSTPARYESDSDDTCCDIFDPPKKRKMVINTSEEEDAIPQVESQRPGTVPAVFVLLDEDSLKALKDAVRERIPNTEVAEIRALLWRKCSNKSYKSSSNSSQS
ncbi:uncharacterized protein LOC113061563 isoform X1 [Carassius auratus]|uniref:Uncharacterized protein LOC113061563 isoform X1 n=2 Tax=Carassius auratus TaxID=7957 RepID=A0A6P6LPU0_CARAU|nr:uncharacterized protein LOC113061563 isoform X1 [Carassius auratus]